MTVAQWLTVLYTVCARLGWEKAGNRMRRHSPWAPRQVEPQRPADWQRYALILTVMIGGWLIAAGLDRVSSSPAETAKAEAGARYALYASSR